MAAFPGVILSFYCVLLLTLLVGWIRVRRQHMPLPGQVRIGFSIVVAVRNEAANLDRLLANLGSIAYPADAFEVIVVNDHSTDITPEEFEDKVRRFPPLRQIALPVGQEGKKTALLKGILASRFDVIVTTDADCTVSKNWLLCLANYFGQPGTKMVVGAVKLAGNNSFFSRLQIVEFLSLVGSTAAAIGLGHPIMCNGANLSFRKDAFQEVMGYDDNLHVPSGDDEFLMRKIFRVYPYGIRFLNYYEMTVVTPVLPTASGFYQQRIRWAGKWKNNPDLLTRLLALFILLAQISFAGLIIQNLLSPDKTLGLLFTKIFLEGVFIAWAGRFLDRSFDWPAFLTLQIIYPMYVVSVGVASLFSPYRWKGRIYK